LLSINQQEDDYHFFVYFKINESFSELFKVKNFKKKFNKEDLKCDEVHLQEGRVVVFNATFNNISAMSQL
jgi:hypothetical protein